MNVAQLSFDTRSQKWIATFAGRVLISSPNKEYCVTKIREGQCTKAKAARVTDVHEVGTSKEVDGLTQSVKVPTALVDRFPINDRFDFLSDFVGMVADRTAPSLLVTGEGGLGKTYTVNKSLKNAGLKDISDLNELPIGPQGEDRILYTVIKGYSTAKGMYRTLFENRNRLVIYDDCDTVLRDPTALNLLKGALDSYERRFISWNAEAWGSDDLPRSFEFKGGVIFISNLPIYKIDQAVRSRCISIDLSMSNAQKIERMRAIVKLESFEPNYSLDIKLKGLKLLEKFKDDARELSLRTLISVIKVAGRGGDRWEQRAEYLITAA